jgi:hypothetical protein
VDWHAAATKTTTSAIARNENMDLRGFPANIDSSRRSLGRLPITRSDRTSR